MKAYYIMTKDGKESITGSKFYRAVKRGVRMYRYDELAQRLAPAGQSSRACYDFIGRGDEKEYTFPDGEVTVGISVIYRWSTNPFTCIIKKKDLVEI
ncbi:MAG: hypothetical protein K6G01_05405 [Eubacterium sp.]|nr:hypothetical protein [Eubacterium sp.]